MKRYSLVNNPNDVPQLKYDDKGEYVKYEDYVDMKSKLAEKLADECCKNIELLKNKTELSDESIGYICENSQLRAKNQKLKEGSGNLQEKLVQVTQTLDEFRRDNEMLKREIRSRSRAVTSPCDCKEEKKKWSKKYNEAHDENNKLFQQYLDLLMKYKNLKNANTELKRREDFFKQFSIFDFEKEIKLYVERIEKACKKIESDVEKEESLLPYKKLNAQQVFKDYVDKIEKACEKVEKDGIKEKKYCDACMCNFQINKLWNINDEIFKENQRLKAKIMSK